MSNSIIHFLQPVYYGSIWPWDQPLLSHWQKPKTLDLKAEEYVVINRWYLVMTNFSGTQQHSGDKLLCCWPVSFIRTHMLCTAVVESFSALSCDSQWQRYQPDVLLQIRAAREAQNGLQSFWHHFLTPLQIPAASFCLSVPLCSMLDKDVTSWLTSVLCLWEAQALLFCNQLCSWSQANASHRYPGEVGHIWGTFSLKWKHHLGHVLEEEVFGCLRWVLLTVILVFHADFGKLF